MSKPQDSDIRRQPAKEPEGWLSSRIQLIIKHRVQILQSVLALLFFLLAVGSLQYMTLLSSWLHVSDMTMGKVMVYSLPFWNALAFFLIWRS